MQKHENKDRRPRAARNLGRRECAGAWPAGRRRDSPRRRIFDYRRLMPQGALLCNVSVCAMPEAQPPRGGRARPRERIGRLAEKKRRHGGLR
jgi:hypothetical protein